MWLYVVVCCCMLLYVVVCCLLFLDVLFVCFFFRCMLVVGCCCCCCVFRCLPLFGVVVVVCSCALSLFINHRTRASLVARTRNKRTRTTYVCTV